MPRPDGLIEAEVTYSVGVDPYDVHRAFDSDASVLLFVCQLLALRHSSELREELREKLGPDWDDDDYINRVPEEES